MQRYILIRFLQGLFALWAVTLIVFVISRATGDPATIILGIDASASDLAALRERLGLNEPLLVQYGIYMGSVLQGDLGESLKFPEQGAGGAVMTRLPGAKSWHPLASVAPDWDANPPTMGELRRWVAPLVAANPTLAPLVAHNLHPRRRPLQKAARRVKQALRRTRRPAPAR